MKLSLSSNLSGQPTLLGELEGNEPAVSHLGFSIQANPDVQNSSCKLSILIKSHDQLAGETKEEIDVLIQLIRALY